MRKRRALRPEVATRVIRAEAVKLVRLAQLRPEDIPNQPGVYRFLDSKSEQTLYVGEALSLRRRLRKHAEHSDNKNLARHFWESGIDNIIVAYSVFAEGISKRELRAIELEQIRATNAIFNVVGSP